MVTIARVTVGSTSPAGSASTSPTVKPCGASGGRIGQTWEKRMISIRPMKKIGVAYASSDSEVMV
ncbi:hypothetical protein GCM10027615_44750 [Plantactinospora veratri]